MIFSPLTWTFGVSLAALLMKQVVKPRLPVYTLQVVRFPSVKFVHHKFLTQITTDVSLHNDNYARIDVHAILFDMFVPDWNGQLHHVGVIQDSQSAEQLQLRDQRHRQVPSDAVWEIAPRANFTTVGQLYVDVTSFSNMLTTMTRLISSWWHGSGSLLLPTTGIAYIKANGKTPLTVSLVCDNLVNTWRMNVVGLECGLHSLNVGWSDMDLTVKKLRDHARSKLRANETGGVLTHPQPDLSDMLKRIAS